MARINIGYSYVYVGQMNSTAAYSLRNISMDHLEAIGYRFGETHNADIRINGY